MYTVPLSFSLDSTTAKTPMSDLKTSDMGFVFSIGGNTYTIDEAEKLIGDDFDPKNVTNIKPYNDPKYAMPDKKAVYMIVMKKS